MGWEEPFIVITKIGGDVITADTPTPLKVNAGVTVTLQLTVPDTYTVTGLKANAVTPQKTPGPESEYTFKMPQAATTVSGNLTPKTQEDLVQIESVFDTTLQDLYIAQGVLAIPATLSVAAQSSNYIRPFRNNEEVDGEEEDGGEEETAEPPSVFAPDVTSYTAEVPFSGYPAVITAIPSDSEAFVEVSSTEPDGNKFTVTIEVTSSFWHLYPEYKKTDGDGAWVDGDKSKTYTIEVTREAGNSDTGLSLISVLETELTTSDSGETYAGTVASNVEKLNINATAAYHNARVQVTSGGATYPANLTNAENSISKELAAPSAGASGEITVKVTPEDGSAKDYTMTIYRAQAASSDPVFNASGGAVSIKEIDGVDYEIHTFIVDSSNTQLGGQTSSELTFTTAPAGGTVAVLVVAGGGAGGKSGHESARSGGGGAGGFIYHPKYAVGAKKTFAVKVGAGGAKSSSAVTYHNTARGGNGGDSAFGDDFIAKGGGGGGNHSNLYWGDGLDGGSGGGSGNHQGGKAVTTGKAPSGALSLGNKGGTTEGYGWSGGGGGGAKTAGVDITKAQNGGNGGSGTQSAVSGTLSWYSGGGAGGAEDKYNDGEQYGAKSGNSGAAGTGDGGSGAGGVSGISDGGNGGSGIVIVRWPFVSE